MVERLLVIVVPKPEYRPHMKKEVNAKEGLNVRKDIEAMGEVEMKAKEEIQLREV